VSIILGTINYFCILQRQYFSSLPDGGVGLKLKLLPELNFGPPGSWPWGSGHYSNLQTGNFVSLWTY